MSFCIQEHASFGASCEKRNRKVISFVLSQNEEKHVLGGGGGGGGNEEPLGVSDVGQVTISLSAVRG